MRRLLLALLVAAVTSGIASEAAARCAGPSIAFAPADGSFIDPEVTWVFVPRNPDGIEIAVKAGGKTIPATVTEESRNDTFTAYRVALDREATGRNFGTFVYDVEVTTAFGEYKRVASARYKVPGRDNARHDGPLALENAEYTKSEWTCSHTDSVTAMITQYAPAYRLEWSRTEAAYRAGEREILVVPWSMKAFWTRHEPITRKDKQGELALGHLNCFGETIPAEALAETVYVGIVPLYGTSDEIAPEDPIAIRSGNPPHIEQLGPVEEAEPEAEVIPDDFPEKEECGMVYLHQQEIERERRMPLGIPLALLGFIFGLPLGRRWSRRLPEDSVARLDAWSIPQTALVVGGIAALLPLVTLATASSLLPAAVTALAAFAGAGAAAAALWLIWQRIY